MSAMAGDGGSGLHLYSRSAHFSLVFFPYFGMDTRLWYGFCLVRCVPGVLTSVVNSAVMNRDGVPHAQLEARAGGRSPSSCSICPPSAIIFLWTHGGRCGGSLRRLPAHSSDGGRLTLDAFHVHDDGRVHHVRCTSGLLVIVMSEGFTDILNELRPQCVARSCPSEPSRTGHPSFELCGS